MRALTLVLFSAYYLIYGQNLPLIVNEFDALYVPNNLHDGLTEKIGNFSIEVLYHTYKVMGKNQNLIMSPITLWTVLTIIAEGATGSTRAQLNNLLRITKRYKEDHRNSYQTIHEWLQVNTSTVDLANINSLFIDKNDIWMIEKDFQKMAEMVYKLNTLPIDFANSAKIAESINSAVTKLISRKKENALESYTYIGFGDNRKILMSAIHFNGQWSVPFSHSSTAKMPFYDSNSKKTGEVDMMHSHFKYPFAIIKELEGKVIELTYGKEEWLTMLVLLPDEGVSVEKMFSHLAMIPLDSVFETLRLGERYLVDCFLPRFRIESSLDVTRVLKERLGVVTMFDKETATFPIMARAPLHVNKVFHKATIEVTEDGTTSSAVKASEFTNETTVASFEANRPFCFLIVEKVTNSIVFGGFYQQP